MSISRLTRERLYQDERVFNELLPYAKYDDENHIYIHSDASLWSIWELKPKWLTTTSDEEAFQLCARLQETFDAFEHTISIQVSWITTFDVDKLLDDNLNMYPTSGVAGWMAKRWNRALRRAAKHGAYSRRPRKIRLILCFRYDPPWRARGALEKLKETLRVVFLGRVGVSAEERKQEYLGYVNKFRGVIDGTMSKLRDLGFDPTLVTPQELINLMYPLLNRRSTKVGKFKRNRSCSIPVPVYDPDELLCNQISQTPVFHPDHGLIQKDGRFYRCVSMVKPPKQCFPLMISQFQSTPYENILSITLSKDPKEKQLARLDALDTTLGFREFTAMGRSNQKIQHQIATIRAARNDFYNGTAQLVRVGVHQTFICQTAEEAIRATSEALATYPHLNGARGMVHEISDLGMLINSLPGCYDPATDGPGWTVTMRSSRAVRLMPLWGNWQGSKGRLFVLPSLWNRELVGFDLYDSNVAPNTLISGVSGAGKSYLLNYIIICMNRGHYSIDASGKIHEKPPITFIFDKGMVGQPCGFEKVAKLFGGRIYEATPSRAPAMNFLARLGKTPPDLRNQDYRDLLDMCADIICDMAAEGDKTLDRIDRAIVNDCLTEAHKIYRNGPMKREFILSDVVAVLKAPKKVSESEDTVNRRQRIALLISDYYGGGTFARFFDRPGALQLKERFIVFDLKALSRNPDLQRVFLKVAMLWADTVMNEPSELDTRKLLVFDEAHDLIGKTSSHTVETAFRLYRKRKGIVIAASQSGEDFYLGQGGQAIVQNSAHKIFLRQDPNKFHYTAKAFALTDQQADIILRLRTVKGIESQFYLISDIGEAALVLPVEPSFYWVSTNNGDDNQLFAEVLKETDGDFFLALRTLVEIAPNGAVAFRAAQEELLKHSQGNGTNGAGGGFSASQLFNAGSE